MIPRMLVGPYPQDRLWGQRGSPMTSSTITMIRSRVPVVIADSATRRRRRAARPADAALRCRHAWRESARDARAHPARARAASNAAARPANRRCLRSMPMTALTRLSSIALTSLALALGACNAESKTGPDKTKQGLDKVMSLHRGELSAVATYDQ